MERKYSLYASFNLEPWRDDLSSMVFRCQLMQRQPMHIASVYISATRLMDKSNDTYMHMRPTNVPLRLEPLACVFRTGTKLYEALWGVL